MIHGLLISPGSSCIIHVAVCAFPTTAVTFLLIAAIHAVGIGITAPANRDAMTIFALELVTVAFYVTAILDQRK